MMFARKSSRLRYREYRQYLRDRAAGKVDVADSHRSASRLAASGGMMGMSSMAGLGHKRQRSFFELFRRFWGMLAGHRFMVALMLTALTIATVIGLAPLYATKLVVDNVLGGRPVEPWLADLIDLPTGRGALLNVVVVAMVVLSTVSILFGVWGRWQATRMTKRVQVSVRRRVFDHAIRLPLHRVFELKSGGAASLLREDAGGVGELIFAMIYNPWRAVIQFTGSLIILSLTDWRLLIGSLVLIPTVFVTHRTWIGRIRPIFRDVRATRQDTDAHATETFGGMRVVRSFARQRSESAQFTSNNALMARQEVLAWWWSRAVDIAWALLVPAASAALLWYGGHRILHDAQLLEQGLITPRQALTIGDLVMFLAYLGWLLGPLEVLAVSATQLQNGLAGLDRVVGILEEPTEMANKPDARVLPRGIGSRRITLEGVSFAYPRSQQPVLKDVSLDVAPGQTVALVGPSGAGKTTLCNLIARFYDPTAGRITFDGTDLRDIDVDSYRALLGIVEQDTFLFDGSIAQNIAYGRRDATMPQVVEAARRANAHEFIERLPRGYESQIGERGVKLSGGQRQRLSIARALLADPRILILDEATSNLDTESERLIQDSLRTLMAGRTCFVIAHRLSTIAHAHHIVVIEHGRVIEQGRHEDLMSASTRYRQMVELQTSPPTPVVENAPA